MDDPTPDIRCLTVTISPEESVTVFPPGGAPIEISCSEKTKISFRADVRTRILRTALIGKPARAPAQTKISEGGTTTSTA